MRSIDEKSDIPRCTTLPDVQSAKRAWSVPSAGAGNPQTNVGRSHIAAGRRARMSKASAQRRPRLVLRAGITTPGSCRAALSIAGAHRVEFGVIVLVLLVFGFWHADQKEKAEKAQRIHNDKMRSMAEAEREEERQAEWEQRVFEIGQAEADLIDFTVQHKRTLLTKERQLTYTDDYGRIDNSAYIKELEYFVEKVVPANIRDVHIQLYDEDATLIMRGTVQICLLQAGEAAEPSAQAYEAGMSGVEFERLVAERLACAGANVRFTPATGDQGADLIVEHNGETIVVQCKRSASTVGNKAVQEAFAGRKFHDAEQAWVVSDAPFSRAARQLASSLSVRLIDFDQVEAAL